MFIFIYLYVWHLGTLSGTYLIRCFYFFFVSESPLTPGLLQFIRLSCIEKILHETSFPAMLQIASVLPLNRQQLVLPPSAESLIQCRHTAFLQISTWHVRDT